MDNKFTLTVTIKAQAGKIYEAWLSSEGHSAMTGSPAKVDGRVKGDFTAWDGYIRGTFLELVKDRRIVQTWRTSEFPQDSEDSRVEILLEEKNGETTLTLLHTTLPAEQADEYKQGWEDFYFKPMKEYFS